MARAVFVPAPGIATVPVDAAGQEVFVALEDVPAGFGTFTIVGLADGDTFEGVPDDPCGAAAAAACACAGTDDQVTIAAESASAVATDARLRPADMRLENTADILTPHQYAHIKKLDSKG